jgi:hypothetical protein
MVNDNKKIQALGMPLLPANNKSFENDFIFV